MTSLFPALRIVELAEGVAGPFCGKLFAGLGADVIKVESPSGDHSRAMGPFPGDIPDPARSGMYLHLNTGKRSIVLPPGDANALDQLLAGADAVILSGRPSELAAAGLAPAELSARYPCLVVTAVSLFGQTGPYAEYLGGELIAYAASSYMSLTGASDRHPIKAYGNLVEFVAGAHAALGTLAAITSRDFSGRGQVVDCSITQAGTFLLGGVEQSAYFYDRISRRNGTRLMGLPPQQPYPSTIRPCRDGYIHAHSNNRHLDLLYALIPHERLLAPDLLAAMSGHADEIDAIMDDWLRDRDRADIVREAQVRRLPFTEVMLPGEVLSDPHHIARGSFVTLNHPVAGELLQPGAPIKFHGTPWQTGPAPALGQHTAEVLSEPQRPAAANAKPATRSGPRPLSGFRIVDFTNAIAGPISTSILADLGAEVIKVEAPNGRPRGNAGTAPLAPDANEDRPWDRMMLYNSVNHGKKSIVLDVNKPEGRRLLLELVAASDGFVQNFSPRALDNMRLGYDDLTLTNPNIVYVSMPAFGLSGPYRDRVSYGPGIDAMSGLSHLTGYEDGPPMKPGNFFCDQNAAVLSAFAMTAALRHREQTGEGQHVELAMIEGEFQIIGDAYIDFVMNGRERHRCGNDHPTFAPHDAFPCSGDDAWVAIGVETDEQWRALCAVIGQPSLAHDSAFASAPARIEARARLQSLISAWTSERTSRECQELLQSAGVPAAAVPNSVEILRDPHVVANDGFEYGSTPNIGRTPYPRLGFRLSDTPTSVVGPPPAFGQHLDEVLSGLLRHSAAELEQFEHDGIICREPIGTVARK